MTTPVQAQDPTPAAGSTSTERRGINRRRMFAISGTAAVAGAAVATGGTLLLTRDTNTSGSVPSTALAPSAAPAPSSAATPTLAYTESGVGVPAISTIAADASPEFRSICDALQQAMQKKPVPGAALGMLSGDREEYAYFGIESINTNVVVGPGTLFQLGSAVPLVRPADDACLDDLLDDPVQFGLGLSQVLDTNRDAVALAHELVEHVLGRESRRHAGQELDDRLARHPSGVQVLDQLHAVHGALG
jgi:hypothetical protein